jgi:hypothetical protein
MVGTFTLMGGNGGGGSDRSFELEARLVDAGLVGPQIGE